MAAILRSESPRPVLLGRLSKPSGGIKGACTKVVKTGMSAATAVRSAACASSKKLPVLLGRTRAVPPKEQPIKSTEMTVEVVPQVGVPSVDIIEVQQASNPAEEARRMALEARRAVMERKALRASRDVRLDDEAAL